MTFCFLENVCCQLENSCHFYQAWILQIMIIKLNFILTVNKAFNLLSIIFNQLEHSINLLNFIYVRFQKIG